MKDFKVDGKLIRAFVLTETDSRIVYIPLKALHRVDYDRLKKMETDKPAAMRLLDFMKKTTLDNGRNALVQYDKIIQVAEFKGDKKTAIRMVKPDEAETALKAAVAVAEAAKEMVASAASMATFNPTSGNAPIQLLNETSGVGGTSSETKETVPEGDVQYKYLNNQGKPAIWGGKGRVPDAIQKHLDGGGKLEDLILR